MLQEVQFQTTAKVIKLGNAAIWIKNHLTQNMGLTAIQSEAMYYILNHKDDTITASNLMDTLQLSQSTVAGILRRLESNGFIIRMVAENDNRKSIIKPAEKGLELEELLKTKTLETEEILLSSMTAEERAEFNRLLQKALDTINSVREKDAER